MGDVMVCVVVLSVNNEVGRHNRDHQLANGASLSATHHTDFDYFFLATHPRRHSARFLLSRDPIIPDDVRWLGLDPLLAWRRLLFSQPFGGRLHHSQRQLLGQHTSDSIFLICLTSRLDRDFCARAIYIYFSGWPAH
jgi:hypothetical protein